MMQLAGFLAPRLATTAIAASLFAIANHRVVSTEDGRAASELPRFVASYLEPADNGRPMRGIRDVHPDLKHIDAWISSVGAAVALAYIAGSGHPADICLVDPRNDSVSILPAPETGARFASFALPLPTDGYDPATIAPMGCQPVDVNEDGRMDLVVYY